MRFVRLRTFTLILAQACSIPLWAQGGASIADVDIETCATLLPSPEEKLREIAPDLSDETGFSLMVEAIQRQCGALGALSLAADAQDDPTRSHGSSGQTPKEQSESLAREARYYFETAMQIDPDASNDLLRRLLGRDPKPEN